MVQPLWRFFKKLKLELPPGSSDPTSGNIPDKTRIQKDTCTRIFIGALFTIAKTWRQPTCPSTEEWIRTWCIYTVDSAIKRK